MPFGDWFPTFQQRTDVTAPIFPLRRRSTACLKCAADRCCVPTWTMRLYLRAASTIARPSAMVTDVGFST